MVKTSKEEFSKKNPILFIDPVEMQYLRVDDVYFIRRIITSLSE